LSARNILHNQRHTQTKWKFRKRCTRLIGKEKKQEQLFSYQTAKISQKR
jgi:hypothetical protein